MREFLTTNRSLVLFLYGQTFFIMGLAVFLQSRRHSRLRLGRDLRWLAAFGILHSLHEWGDVFIPFQAAYLSRPYIELLLTLQIVLLAASFACLMIFGAVTVAPRWPRALKLVLGVAVIWGLFFWLSLYSMPTFESWYRLSAIWARYLLGLPGSLLAAYGLRYQAETFIQPLGDTRTYRALRIAGWTLVAYAILGGFIVRSGEFFPANTFNGQAVESLVSIPIEVFRSAVGLIMAISVIRALEVFDLEVDRLIEGMEIERIQGAERDRIGQEIHDGAIQGVYSASLILESIQQHVKDNAEATLRLDRARRVLNAVNTDLRQYMISLRANAPSASLMTEVRQMANDPRFSSLIRIQVRADVDPDLKPSQTAHVLAIVQESLSNAVRHAKARQMMIGVHQDTDQWVIRLEDDGQGFDETEVAPGYGLRAMRDRARLLGATLAVQSSAGKGTTVLLIVPQEKSL